MNWSQFVRDTASVATAYNTYQNNKKLDTLNESLNDFKNQTNAQLLKLTDSLEKGFSMLSMEMAVQSKIFKNILNVLKEKRKTEAEELKNFGLKALRNGWVEDAIDDFTKSIEINRYDYQVYYLLSKCYFLKSDIEKQEHYLQMAFQYSAEDPLFRQYIGLDIVGQLVKEKKFDEAKNVVDYLDTLIDGKIHLSPFLMCKIYIDIFSENVNDKTLQNIDNAIDHYEGDEPYQIITVIKALNSFVSSDKKILIDNKLNLKQFDIAKKYGKNVLTYLDNIDKILSFVYFNSDNSSILKIAPDSVISLYFPLYKSIPKFIDRIRDFKARVSNLSINDLEKFNFISPVIKHVEEEILKDVSSVYKKIDDGIFNSNPFQQGFKPEIEFKVDPGDKILVQCKLNNNEFITLTYFKLIIIDKNKNTFIYDLIENFLSVEKNEIRLDDLRGSSRLTDKITFYLRDKISNKILLFSSSENYSEGYIVRDKYANILNLLWSRALNNIILYLEFKKFNNDLNMLNACIDFIFLNAEQKSYNLKYADSHEVEFLNNSSESDVEFID